jgi:RNA polymerase sigma-70 factor (ECF subfamily)
MMAQTEQADAIPVPVPLPAAVDDDLVRRCQAGDREPFRQLVERYGNIMFGTALQMTGDRSLAEELTQDAFVNAWRGIGGFRLGSPLRPWLLRILHNRVVSHKRRRLLDLLPLPSADRARDGQPGPETVVELGEGRAEMRAALDGLPHDQRRIVVLRYYSELSIPEIAQVIGVPDGTVKSRLHRALQRLRQNLETTQRSDES